MIDLHSHVLPGLDDGARTQEDALAMARAAVQDGISCVVATPHIDHVHDLGPLDVLRAGLELRRLLGREGVPLELLTGGEVTALRALELSDSELRALALGTSSWVLLECPLTRGGVTLEEALFALELRGFRALLAHPERSPHLLGDSARVRELVDRGALCSITAGSLLGRFGLPARTFALELLDRGLVHNVGSDGHDAARRPLALGKALDAVVFAHPNRPGLRHWLGDDVPRALLSDRAPPVLPPPPARRPRPVRSRRR